AASTRSTGCTGRMLIFAGDSPSRELTSGSSQQQKLTIRPGRAVRASALYALSTSQPFGSTSAISPAPGSTLLSYEQDCFCAPIPASAGCLRELPYHGHHVGHEKSAGARINHPG